MKNWKSVCEMLCQSNQTENEQKINEIQNIIKQDFDLYRVYPSSIQQAGEAFYMLAMVGEQKKLVVCGNKPLDPALNGNEVNLSNGVAKVCELTNDNCTQIRRIFPFVNPSNHHGKDITIGLGDRLGLASAGHIRLIRDKEVFPVLAQQSIRELNLTGRTYQDVLAAACWAVFQEGYTKGFGADGDHLKTPEEVQMAIDCGFTMITLDCSEHIDNSIVNLSDADIENKYMQLNQQEVVKLEDKYLGKEVMLENGDVITFTPQEFKKIVLIYLKAIQYTVKIYHEVINACARGIDFEMSIDETLTSTAPAAHYFVAKELIDAGVTITSLAPRFCGEFQKGIDYIGDQDLFLKEFQVHAAIAKHLHYKISVHSGSDKFSVFPVIGAETKGQYHLKTAGTNWLEAVRVIAEKNPSLYRRMHAFALTHLAEAKKYYHIGAQTSNIPDIAKLSDGELPGLMNQNDARQVLHITYGLILLAKKEDGSSLFRDEIYTTLRQFESAYNDALKKHIGKHLDLLRV